MARGRSGSDSFGSKDASTFKLSQVLTRFMPDSTIGLTWRPRQLSKATSPRCTFIWVAASWRFRKSLVFAKDLNTLQAGVALLFPNDEDAPEVRPFVHFGALHHIGLHCVQSRNPSSGLSPRLCTSL